MKTNSNIFIAVVLFLCTVAACNSVKLDYDTSEIESSIETRLKWNWSGVQKGRPDSMCVIYNRYLNTLLDTTVRGVFLCPSEQDTMVTTRYGQYHVMSFNIVDSLYDTFNVDAFKDVVSVSTGDIGLRLKTKAFKDVIGDTLYDYNVGISFVDDAGPLYASFSDRTFSPGQPSEVELKPENISGHLNIVFRVFSSPDVEIDYLRAYISGIVGKIHPKDGIVSRDTLYRQELDIVSDGNSMGDTGLKKFYYEAKGDILGIFPSMNSEIVFGPGVMNVVIGARIGDRKRTYYRARNLSDIIDLEDVMAYSPNYSGYSLAVDTISLEVPDTIRIGKISNDGGGVNVWIDNERRIPVEI